MPGCAQVDLVGVGLNATDTVIRLPTFPAVGSKTEYREVSVLPGGQVATSVVACARWGLRTRYVGRLGSDDAARIHERAFEAAGVETRITTVPEAGSAQSLILVDETGERTVLCRRDERLELRPTDMDRDWVVRARALLVDGFDTEAAVCAARWAQEAGVPVVADLDEPYPGIERLLELVDYPVVSRDFPARLTGDTDLERALVTMHRRYGAKVAAATLGPDGVLAWDGRRFEGVAAFRVPVEDTTGAGDLFHAGFVYGLLQDWTLERQLEFACAAAALNCMAVGARGGIGEVAEIEARVRTGERYAAPEVRAAVVLE